MLFKNIYNRLNGVFDKKSHALPGKSNGVLRRTHMAVLGLFFVGASHSGAECQPINDSSFRFLKERQFSKFESAIGIEGITNTCDVAVLKSSVMQIFATTHHRSLGPPHGELWIKNGWATSKALREMNNNPAVAVPLRTDSADRPEGNKRMILTRINKWEILSNLELIVDLQFTEQPTDRTKTQRVRYKSKDGASWYIDEILL